MIYEVKSDTGSGCPAVRSGVAGANNANMVANALIKSSSGKMILATAGASTTQLAGVLLNDAVTTDAPLTYVPFLDGVSFLIDTSSAITQANVGKAYGITVSSGQATLNISDTTYKCLVITALDAGNTSRAWVRALSTINQNLVEG